RQRSRSFSWPSSSSSPSSSSAGSNGACNTEEAWKMVENRPFLNFLSHLVLIIGVVAVIFPVYLAFIASTRGPDDFYSGLVPLLPGPHMGENYYSVMFAGMQSSGAPPLLPMLVNSLIMALGVAIGKISISILSAY